MSKLNETWYKIKTAPNKKKLLLVLGIILTFSTISLVAALYTSRFQLRQKAAAPELKATLSLESSTQEVAPGDEFSVNIKVNTQDAYIHGIQSIVEYPTDLLEVVEVTQGKDIQQTPAIFSNYLRSEVNGNKIYLDGAVDYANPIPYKSGNGTFGRIKFKALRAGTAEIKFVFNKTPKFSVDSRGDTDVLYLDSEESSVYDVLKSVNDLSLTIATPAEPTPAISSLNPTSGIAGSQVTIAGRNFGPSQGQVNFGTSQASISSWGETEITFTVPANATPGQKEVTVVTSQGQSEAKTYTVTEEVGELSCQISTQSTNLAAGATKNLSVSISGGSSPYTVTWSAQSGTLSNQSGTQTVYTAPARAGSDTIIATVTDNSSPTQQTTCQAMVSVSEPSPNLSLTGIEPGYGFKTRETNQTISGSGFKQGVIVNIGSAEATVDQVSATSLTITAPTGINPGLYEVTVSVSSESKTLTDAFRSTVAGDCNGDNGKADGKVDIYDLNKLIRNWNKTENIDMIDTNGAQGGPDGKVDIYDFNKLLVNWTGYAE